MTFIKLDGKTIPAFADSLTEELIDIGGPFERGINGAPLKTRVRQLRRWTFRTPAMTYANSQLYWKWIEGYGIRVPVSRGGAVSEYASTGIVDNTAGTNTFALATGPHGISDEEKLTVGSGSTWGAQLSNRMGSRRARNQGGWSANKDGATICGWRKWTGSGAAVNEGVGATAWRHTVAAFTAGNTEFARGSSADPTGLAQYLDGALQSAPTNTKMGNIIGMQTTVSPYISLHGKRNDGTSEAVEWSDVIVVPFTMDSTWVSQIYSYAQTYQMGDRPFLWMTGDVVGSERVSVLGSVLRSKQLNAVPAGASAVDNNMRELEIELLEAPRYTRTP